MPSFTVVVPALNEEENLRPTVEAVLKEIGPLSTSLEVLVFDDASADRTGEIADDLAQQDERVQVFHNPRRLNIGGIYKAGVRAARGDFVFLVPGDNETRVDEIARVLPYVDQADLLVLYVTNVSVRPATRRVLSRLYVWIVNALFGAEFLYTNGTNVFRTAAVRGIPILTDGFSYQTEALVRAVRSGVDFVQVGVEIRGREFGASKAISWKNVRSVVATLAGLWWEVNVAERQRYHRRGRMLGTF